jgi:uncharacterized protein YciI
LETFVVKNEQIYRLFIPIINNLNTIPMNQYLITAYDFTDTDALNRRMAIRPLHLDAARQLRETGNFVLGGAMLNDEGKMIGSVMVLQFETEEQLAAWKQDEPYITQKVWETVDIKPFKVANLDA